MWCSPRESVQTSERAHGVGKGRGDDEFAATSNVDSGFLSAGSMQDSGEVRDCGAPRPQREEDDRRMRDESRRAAPGATTSRASPVAGSQPARLVDSGVVDVDLSEGLNQLALRQRRPGPALPAAAPGNDPPLEPHRQDGVNKLANTWRLYEQDKEGDTQLHIAIMQSYVEAALVLIRLAPDPLLLDTCNDVHQSPLYLAVLMSQSLIVRRLILAGADPSVRNIRGDTALHLACNRGDLACAKALTDPLSPMERNQLMPGQTVPALPQNLEQRNYNGEMCLHVAVANGHVNLVRLLLRLGADLEAREALSGRTALHLAIERKCHTVVKFLLQECKPCLETQTYGGLTAYQLALSTDCQLAKDLVVRHGAKPEPLPESDSESSSENSSEDEAYGEASYLPAIVKMQNAVEVNV
ncbi:PREDICTED: NF-kappa-B inhibitor cactus-like [Vollenhovia emeryi]|uniref:NF-kappa-B inhibitor cactus-like n=1 Tax=Vollenhovia emeryi TaxID=411798 RepID=UPI0005F3BAB6|nr:PREDICTED: NF-kappa-B inhibitor cactus-like [Vollenhovia emeryi]